MEKVELFGVPCYRMKTCYVDSKFSVYRYDKEPDEVAHYYKTTRRWDFITREKKARCALKKGDIVEYAGYLYGRKQELTKVSIEKSFDQTTQILSSTIQNLVQNKVFTIEEGRERLLRHVSPQVAEEMLQSL